MEKFEGLQVGNALFIEEFQIPHKTLTTYTDRYTQCGVITCITTKSHTTSQIISFITLISATSETEELNRKILYGKDTVKYM
jgi:hypothetical protein